MAIKSLTITEDAYDVLKRLKYADESFSEAILRIGSKDSFIIDKYFGILKEKDPEEWIKEIKKERAKADQEVILNQKKLRGIK